MDDEVIFVVEKFGFFLDDEVDDYELDEFDYYSDFEDD